MGILGSVVQELGIIGGAEALPLQEGEVGAGIAGTEVS